MNKYILSSGKVVELNLATTEVALELFREVLNAAKNTGLNLEIKDEETLQDVLTKNTETILNIFSSKTLVEAIKDCCSKVIYDKKRFSMELFESEEARGDLIPILQLVALENLRPFFPQARMFFDILLDMTLKN